MMKIICFDVNFLLVLYYFWRDCLVGVEIVVEWNVSILRILVEISIKIVLK